MEYSLENIQKSGIVDTQELGWALLGEFKIQEGVKSIVCYAYMIFTVSTCQTRRILRRYREGSTNDSRNRHGRL